MNGPLTLDEVLEAGLPAFGGELYRYSPATGFFRATTARFAPSWLPVPWPAHDDQVSWHHEEACACRFCRGAATAPMTIDRDSEAAAGELARTA
jgi:hypothetical protein